MIKILVCDPTYYGIEYSINPWMNVENQVDRNLEVFDTDMSKFIKSGGACKCLTLRLE